MTAMQTIAVSIGHEVIPIDRESFELLFDNSVVADRADVVRAVQSGRIPFSRLVELARMADIPPALFFATPAAVRAQIDRKINVLLSGVSKTEFSLNSRGSVRITDVELILKDILRKQQRLKALDPNLGANRVVGMLRGIANDPTAASAVRHALNLDLVTLRAHRTKGAAFEYAVAQVEAQHIFVSLSVRNWMPQNLPSRARFAGMSVRDKSIPFIFINRADSQESLAPAGRQLLTLVLLTVCIARGKFKRLNYDDRAKNLIENTEYRIAEEVLMPAKEARAWTLESLDNLKELAATCAVTPSAVLMRARRLRLIDEKRATAWSEALREEFEAREPSRARSPKPVNALRKYNGAGYSRAFLRQFDNGAVPASDVVRYLFQNRLRASDIDAFRRAL